MSKRSRRTSGTAGHGKTGTAGTITLNPPKLPPGAPIPVVSGREPCPCGSGQRYKACHGRASRDQITRLVTRPFAGLAGECDWVAMRELVPAATATVSLTAPLPHAGTSILVATVLPMAWPAMRRSDGQVLLGLQTTAGSGDPSRDIAASLLQALDAEPGHPVSAPISGGGPRLQDLIATDAPFEVTVHDGFEFWLQESEELTPEVRDSLAQANASIVPTRRLSSVQAAYWCQVGERRHLRWVLPIDEADLLDGIARLHAAGASALGAGSRFVGSFRVHGVVVPVWDLAADTTADDVEAPASAFLERLTEAIDDPAPLSVEERLAKAGVVSRQLTLR